MSCASRSSTPETTTSDSPPPLSNALTMIRVRVLVYVKDGMYPLAHNMSLPLRQAFRLRDSMWFQQSIPGDHRCDMNIWRGKYEDWTTVNRDEVEIWVTEKSCTFILRLPHVQNCVGLGREIQCREACRLQFYGALSVGAGAPQDIRVPRPEKIGDDFTVVVYPAVLQAPLMFVIRLELDGLIAIWDYPLLAQACFGCDSREEADVNGIRVWDPQQCQFEFYELGESLYAVEGYDFILVRHEYNRYAPGLGRYIAQLEMQTINGVFPTNIPFADPTYTPLARPAQSVRVKRDATWKDYKANEDSGSGEVYGEDDEDREDLDSADEVQTDEVDSESGHAEGIRK
uniref:Dual O-methyltransferase/FAD-dependent monooxygenase CTB3 (Cercosporin toxin biosynthesis cluster protein 3) n=1 Tax=Ganoderma boninense TaxID=34458 RepID=A0A5K1K3V5_9APHY|nr:Dual O-methyltransferase/FAD-dependent monooxygenase CTB3 (Cercosporin toxin biosynthesis cluster protein 3) [Includes: O-methyltransferase (EC, FAD-dependent monooxygenase (EC ] [Ganoderma boninense]